MALSERQQMRAHAVQAAASFVGGTGMNGGDPNTLLYVAEVMEAYIHEGAEAALARYAKGPTTPPPSNTPAHPATQTETSAAPEGASQQLNPRAQELAQQAYEARNRTQLTKIGQDADRDIVKEEVVVIDGVGGLLRNYLNQRWAELGEDKAGDPEATTNTSARESLRSELGLG